MLMLNECRWSKIVGGILVEKKEQAKYLKEIALREKRIAEKGNKLDKSVSVFSTFGVGGL